MCCSGAKMTLPSAHFANLPADILVNIAGWLPIKNNYLAGEPRTHIGRDRGNLSLVNKRTRKVMVSTILFRVLDMCRSSYAHLRELYYHPSWYQAVEMVTIRISVQPSSHLLHGHSVSAYDALLAKVLSRTIKLKKVTWKYWADDSVRQAYSGSLLTETMRALTALSTIRHIAADDMLTNADMYHTLGILQAWPGVSSLKSIYMASDFSNDWYEEPDLQAYLHIWEVIATFPNLDTVVVALRPKPLIGQALRDARLICRPLNLDGLTLDRVYHTRTEVVDSKLVARILGLCSRISNLTLDVYDLAWMPNDVDRRHSVRLPYLRSLRMTRATPHFRRSRIELCHRG